MKNISKASESHILKRREYTALKLYLPAGIAIIALLLLGQIINPGFAAFNNLGNIFSYSCVLIMASISQLLVVLVGGESIDLSVGPVISMTALLVPELTAGSNTMIPLILVIALTLGILVGLINGVGTQIVKIPPLIMTMIMGTVVNGVTYAYTRGQPKMTLPPLLKTVSAKILGPFSAIVILAIIFIVVFELILRKTRYGRSIYLIGSNRKASALTGINIKRNVLAAYLLSSTFAALTGVIMISYLGIGGIQMAEGYTMLSVAALAIGGANMAGGRGTVIGCMLGAVVLTFLSSVLVAAGFNEGIRQLIEGLVLIGVLVAIFSGSARKLQQ